MREVTGVQPITAVADRLGIGREHLQLYGDDKAKIALEARAAKPQRGRLVLVSAITPTDAGEGKTTTSIGLAQGLARIGQSVCLALREPSLGPTFGMKGGATGGGAARVVPEADINLHFTGDFHAISAAHNLLAALLDNHIHQGNALGVDPRRVLWRRVIDMNDRALRNIVICNSVIATKMALAHADWAVTEAGFGFDLGAEKFFDIKCVSAGLDTAAVVLVATVRALKLHGGLAKGALTTADPAAVERGLGNLAKHVESIRAFCEPPVVALNRSADDSDEEIAVVRRACEGLGAPFAASDVFARGGEGGVELAEAVVQHAERKSKPFCPLYDWSETVVAKMEKIARAMYGAHEVSWSKDAEKDLATIRRFGYEGLPLCVAKTQKSLSDDPKLLGRPEEFEIHVRNVILAAGAGYLVPVLGDILRMPGLPATPQAERMDLVAGRVTGMS